MRPSTPIICCLIATLMAICAVSAPTDGSGDPDDQNDVLISTDLSFFDAGTIDGPLYDLNKLKSFISDFTARVVEISEHDEERLGETIDIDRAIDIKGSSQYVIGNANTYAFTNNGSINIKEGGILKLGMCFTVKGEPATVNLSKGSKVMMLGGEFDIDKEVSITVKGTLTSDFDIDSDIKELSLTTVIKGTLDLDGTLSIGGFSIKAGSGKEFDMDATVGISIDERSAIRSLLNISNGIFEIDNGVSISVNVNKFDLNISSWLLTAKSSVKSMNVIVSSPLEVDTLVLDKADITKLSFDMNFLSSIMDRISLHIQNMHADGDSGKFGVSSAEFYVGSMKEVFYNYSLNRLTFSVDFLDTLHCTLYTGEVTTWYGRLDADLDILGDSILYINMTDYYGRLNVPDNSSITGALVVPYRSDSRITIDEDMDIGFATDQDAHLIIFTSMDLVTIFPDDGYRLLELQSERYVGYTIDESDNSAKPDSNRGIYYVNLGQREYTLIFDWEFEIHAYATQIVELPVPEPREGQKFIGWSDSAFTYTDTYEMPPHDMYLEGIWSNDYYEKSVSSKLYTVSTDVQAIIIEEDVMDEIRSMMEDGEIDKLRIEVQKGALEMGKKAVLGLRGGLVLNIMMAYAASVPDYERSIGEGRFFNIDLSDASGIKEKLDDEIRMTLYFEGIVETDNRVNLYNIDPMGRLTEIDCDYDIENGSGYVITETDSLENLVMKSHYKYESEPPTKMLIISMIPGVLVGLILAKITRRS